MFTGIIENKGKVKNISRKQNGANLAIEIIGGGPTFKSGGSVAVNGTCLTITDFKDNTFFVDVVKDTLSRTNLSTLRRGDIVNIEFPMKLGDRLEGHIVEGHIDGMGRITSIIKSGTQCSLKIKIPDNLTRYIVKNGSVSIDGISLTVKEIMGNILGITLIPFTIENTNLKLLRVGDSVNIEVDRMGKYVEKQLNV